MEPAAVAARQLKRNLTNSMWEKECSDTEDIRMAASPTKQRAPWLAPTPLLNLASLAVKEFGSMEPPPMPPPWKRPSIAAAAAAVAAAGAVPTMPLSALQREPLTPMAPMSPPRSPQRFLTPRVSWSEIVSHSQDEEAPMAQSPRTPVFRLRIPSPPARAPLRRRPPSDDESGPCAPGQNEGRFEREFCDVTVIGRGQFSTVYRARNCIDRAVYAVKKTTQISRRGLRRTQLREVFALANVSMEAEGCPNIVRYFSSWFEDGRLHIQTELCECSLRDRLAQRRRKGATPGEQGEVRFGTSEVAQVLRDVANGLNILHGCNFVHLDIKPDNILVSRNPREQGCYKIADLGLAVAAMGSGCDDVSEGDCRYLAKEVLRGDLSDLPKADIFALGLVCYEAATNPRALPCNGEEWQRLREGHLDVDSLAPLAEPLVVLLLNMVRAQPQERPAAKAICSHPSVAPEDGLQALHEKMKQQAMEAERSRRLADAYLQELISFKRQELCGLASAELSCLPSGPLGSAALGGSIAGGSARSRLGTRPRGPRRGKTFG